MNIKQTDLCWIEINTKNLDHNIDIYKKQLSPNNQIIAMIKSNAYGHGARQISSHLEGNPLVHGFCLVNTKEGILLRKNGIKKPIIVVGVINSEPEEIIEQNIEVTIYNFDIAQKLNKVASLKNKTARVHIKVDTGLSRMGILPHELNQFVAKIKQLKNLRIVSIFTHLAKSYDVEASNKQEAILYSLEHNFPTHIGSSKANFSSFKQEHIFTRIGIGMYGYVLHQPKTQSQLKPVFSLKSRISIIKTVPEGTSIGYDQTFITKRTTTFAVLPIGYAEGISPLLSNKGTVIVCDKIAPMIGRINMNYIVIDVTDIPECTINNVVIFIGSSKNQSLSLCDWTEHTGTSPTHLTTNFKKDIPRISV